MLVSWFGAIAFLYDICFRENWSDLMISRKEALVDDGGSASTFQSLLGKVRFVYERLPEWIKDACRLEFAYLRVHCPATNSTIIGESANPNAGRSGNFRRVWLDESAFIPRSEQVFAAVRAACPHGIWSVSTPNGKGNLHYRLRSSDAANFRVVRAHWSEHPERACTCAPGQHRGCWYAEQCASMTPLQIARELDISYESSVAGKVWYAWSDDFIARKPEHDVAYDAGLGPVWRGWDFGVGDQTAILVAQVAALHLANGKTAKQIRIFDAYRNSEQGAVHYREIMQARAAGWNGHPVRDVGDPYNLRSRDSNLTSWQANLADGRHPYKIHVRDSGCRGVPLETVIDNARKFMTFVDCADGQRRPRLLVAEHLRKLIECFEGWSYPTDEEGNVVGDKPKHDEMSHWMSAFYYLAWAIDPLSSAPETYRLEDFLTLDRHPLEGVTL